MLPQWAATGATRAGRSAPVRAKSPPCARRAAAVCVRAPCAITPHEHSTARRWSGSSTRRPERARAAAERHSDTRSMVRRDLGVGRRPQVERERVRGAASCTATLIIRVSRVRGNGQFGKSGRLDILNLLGKLVRNTRRNDLGGA